MLDIHILLWWHQDRGRLSREQQDIISAVDADSSLPDLFHCDPADRILVATARVHGATLLT